MMMVISAADDNCVHFFIIAQCEKRSLLFVKGSSQTNSRVSCSCEHVHGRRLVRAGKRPRWSRGSEGSSPYKSVFKWGEEDERVLCKNIVTVHVFHSSNHDFIIPVSFTGWHESASVSTGESELQAPWRWASTAICWTNVRLHRRPPRLHQGLRGAEAACDAVWAGAVTYSVGGWCCMLSIVRWELIWQRFSTMKDVHSDPLKGL